MRSSAVLAVVGGVACFAACGFTTPVPIGEPEPPADDQPPPPPPPGPCTTFATQFDTCRIAFGGNLDLAGQLFYSTTTHVLTDDRGRPRDVASITLVGQTGEIDAIFARDVRLTAHSRLRAVGMRPFAIVASGSITLEDGAVLDVSGGGAGAQAMCDGGPAIGEDDGGGAAGGGGGGFGADGGTGGNGNSDSLIRESVGGAKGHALAAMPAGPRGGCPGAPGGRGNDPGGLAGPGGGAVYLVAADRIDLAAAAVITAGGGGGGGGGQSRSNNGDAGGGGGGSGGMILLEAPHISGPGAAIAANGGGGGEGSGSRQSGNPGSIGSTTASRTNGGADRSTDGANGGTGGAQADRTGETVTLVQRGGGGGGGGGAGFVHIVSPDAQLGMVSPQPN